MAYSTKQFTQGSGAGVAFDDEYQRIKLAFGTEGNHADVSATSPLPVTLYGPAGEVLLRAEDAPHSSGDLGVMALGVRKDTAAALAGSDGDYQPPIYDANGRIHSNAIQSLANGAAVPDVREGNRQLMLVANGARTATWTSAVQTTPSARGVILYLVFGAAGPGTSETLTLRLYHQGLAGFAVYQVASLATQPGTGVPNNEIYQLIVCPGASGTADNATKNKAYALPVGRQWIAQVGHSGGSSWTYAVYADILM